MSITVTPLSDVLGAAIHGVDLSDPLDADTVAAIHKAWLDHLVVVFPDQTISEGDQIAFCRAFGNPQTAATKLERKLVDEPAYVMAIGNVKENGQYLGTLPDGELTMHTDSIWLERPPKATTLCAIDVPATGGETIFVNMYKAYEALPAELRDILEAHRAIHEYVPGARYRGDELGDQDSYATGSHPACVNHPETGKRVLFVNRLMTTAIEGLPESESKAVLDAVFEHIERPEFRYEHRWTKGDFLMWDNRCLQHGRKDFDPAERRLMKRVTIAGETRPAA